MPTSTAAIRTAAISSQVRRVLATPGAKSQIKFSQLLPEFPQHCIPHQYGPPDVTLMVLGVHTTTKSASKPPQTFTKVTKASINSACGVLQALGFC